MWIVIMILVCSLLFLAIELPTLRRTRQSRDRIVFFVLLIIGAGLNIIEFATTIHLPNPSKLLIVIYGPLYETVRSLLEA